MTPTKGGATKGGTTRGTANDFRAASYARRRFVDRAVAVACTLATLVAIAPLLVILAYIASRGASGLSWEFLTTMERPAREGGGLLNAILGSGVVLVLACGFGIPVGVLAGVYLSEFGANRFGKSVRFAADVMAGIPSIVIGVFVYGIVVVPMQGPSALAGGIAVAILMLPTVARTTEELLRLVPSALREASLALGVSKWRSILRIVLPTAAPGIATGVLLAIARGAGETAPLLFTAGDSSDPPEGIDVPVATLTVKIFEFATSPYQERHKQAWAAALLLIILIVALDLLARVVLLRRHQAR